MLSPNLSGMSSRKGHQRHFSKKEKGCRVGTIPFGFQLALMEYTLKQIPLNR